MNNQIETHIFYHIFLETNWIDIVSDQINTLKNSNILEKSKLHIGVVYGYGIQKDKEFDKLKPILDSVEHEILFLEPTGCCGESATLSKLKSFCDELESDDLILYIHTKGITQYNTIRETPVREWRKMMEYFLVEKWENCVEKLNDGYDCCGINYQDHAANINNSLKLIKIFNGNFFWSKSSYIKKLDNKILFEHRYSAENWILSIEHKAFSFLNVPPSFDLYYNVYEGYKE